MAILDPSTAPSLRELAIMSCGSPDLLERAGRQWCDHLRRAGRRGRIWIADDTRSPEIARQPRAVAGELRRGGEDVAVLGIAERRDMGRRLAKTTGVERELLDFALLDPTRSGYTLGANLNGVLLATAGACVLTVDQDVEPETYRAPLQDATCRVTDATPVHHWWYEHAADTEVWATPCDVLGEHEKWLGRRLSTKQAHHDVQLDVDQAGPRLRARFDRGAQIVGSWMGVLGFAGFADARTIVLEHANEADAADADRLAALLRRPRALRCAPRCTLGPGRDWTSAITAYDNRALLPPFFPIGRGIDLVFGLVTNICRDDAVFAYLPWALRHDRPTVAADAGGMRLNLAAATCDLIARASVGLPTGAPDERMQTLGHRLELLNEMPDFEFQRLLQSIDLSVRSARARQLRSRALRAKTACAEWSRQLQERIDALAAPTGPHIAPRELCTGGVSPQLASRRFRGLLSSYGRVLHAWPSLVQASRQQSWSDSLTPRPCSRSPR